MQRRKKILDLAHELKLPGVARCVDEVMQAATQNSWRAQQIVAELFKAELAGKTARLIRDQMGAAKFPLCGKVPPLQISGRVRLHRQPRQRRHRAHAP